MLLTKHSSSATEAMCGRKLLTQAPDLPCWRNGSTGASNNLPVGLPVMVLKRLPATELSGTGLPWSSLSFGL